MPIDALTEAGVWRTLKRMLNHSKLEIQPLEMFFPFGTSALKPEPVDIDVKNYFDWRPAHVRSFVRIRGRLPQRFPKVRVEFDEEMVMSDAVVAPLRPTVAPALRQERIGPFDRTAVARMLEYGVRLAGRRTRLRRDSPSWLIWLARRLTSRGRMGRRS